MVISVERITPPPLSGQNRIALTQQHVIVLLMEVACFAMTLFSGCGSSEQSASGTTQNPSAASAAIVPFNQVEYTYSQSPAQFAALWSQARTRTVRIALLGDSQETSPEGNGDVYLPRLHYETWLRYGNVPETVVTGYHTYSGQTVPFADWLLSGVIAPPGASPSRVAPERLLPGIPAAAHAAPAGPLSVNGQWYGQLTILESNALGINPNAEIPTDAEYFCNQGPVRAEIFAATHPESGEVWYMARPTDQAPDYFAPASFAGASSLSLAAPSFAVKSFVTQILPRNGLRYLQLELLGSMTSALTDILGMRFISDQCKQGIVIQDLSAGGLSAKDFVDRYGEAGDLFRAMGFDAAILHFGANDIEQGATAETFRADTERLIARIRTWTGDADFPVILMSDPYRKGLNAIMEEEYDRYPGAHRAIAAADPHVLVINSRRLMDEKGWKADRPDRLVELLADDLHYSPRGAIELAETEMGQLLGP
jgi:lysophospholipase L1-like esterase